MFEDKDAQCDGCDWRGEQGQLEVVINWLLKIVLDHIGKDVYYMK